MGVDELAASRGDPPRGRATLSAVRLLIDQRISQVAVGRTHELAGRLDGIHIRIEPSSDERSPGGRRHLL